MRGKSHDGDFRRRILLMVEGLGLAGMLEVPLVIAEVQRPGPVTGFRPGLNR